jgi:hypothetical protein
MSLPPRVRTAELILMGVFFKVFIEDYNLQYLQYTRKKLQNCSDHQFNKNEHMDQKLYKGKNKNYISEKD